MIRRSRTQVDPLEAGVERYVAGGHIDTDALTIDRWGNPSDGQMGSTFRYVFEPGQVLFVSSRPYLRKTGDVGFSGVVADKTYVLDAIPENGLIQRFLPLVLTSDPFVEYATAGATGSMNPRLLWGPLQRYELDLPTIAEQKRIADLLWAVERHRLSLEAQVALLTRARERCIESGLAGEVIFTSLGEAASVVSGVTVGPARRAMPDSAPYLRVANVQRGSLDLKEVKQIGATLVEIDNKGLRRGDVLVVEGHASVNEIGRAAIWNREPSRVSCTLGVP
ncbi:MAG: type restriction enzyme subunit [Mycobacterium sp.]|nr:type restriction enzyme subunit [Mycobacterium sp.]